MMCPVWWFYTIVLGGAFAQVARSLAGQAKEARLTPQHRVHAPTVLWEVFLLVLIVQVWVAVTYFRENLVEMSVLQLGAFLAVPVAIFLLATILNDGSRDKAKDGESDDGEPPEDVRRDQDFGRLRPLFFGVIVAMVIINLVHSLLRGDLAPGVDLTAQLLLLAGGVTGFFLRSRRADTVLAIAMVAVVVGYIALAYGTVSVDA